MDSQVLEQAKKKFGFELWRGVNTLRRNLFIWKFGLAGYQLPSWRPVRLRRIEVPGAPPQIQSIWSRAERGRQILLKLDVFECSSRLAAHELLIEMLANFESPLVERATHLRIGDVAFAGPPNPWLAFARANLVVLLRNAGIVPVEVVTAAETLDDDLKNEPELEPTVAVGEIRKFEARTAAPKAGAKVPLEVDVAETSEAPYWYKIFSEGEVELQEGKLVYRPSMAKQQDIVLFAVLANRLAAVSKALHLKVR